VSKPEQRRALLTCDSCKVGGDKMPQHFWDIEKRLKSGKRMAKEVLDKCPINFEDISDRKR